MRLRTLLIAGLLAMAAAGVLRATGTTGEGETASAGAPPAPSQQRSTPPAEPAPSAKPAPRRQPAIHWRKSVAVGTPNAGSLVRGVQLPARGEGFVSWDANLHRSPDRAWRRWATDRLIRRLLTVSRQYSAAHPAARPLLIGDLSRKHGGNFGRQYGYVWHASHQNGLDADIYYPRTDRKPRQARTAAEINRRLSQDLLDRFVRAGAIKVFVGPGTGLTGPPGVVQVIPQHDDHMHVRFAP